MTIEARAEITALIHVYAELLDAGELDGVAALFAEADYGSPNRGRIHGAAQVRKVYDPVILYADGTPGTKHVISNVTIELVGDTASARSYFTVLQALAGLPLQPIIAGRYHDRFALDGGTWRFAERMILPDLIGDLSHHMRGGPLED
ncbi:MAG: nuclear transport factor 2 family protein [Acidimicrobiia bacterium]